MIPSEHIIYLLTGKKNHFGGAATANIWVTGGLSRHNFFYDPCIGHKAAGALALYRQFCAARAVGMMPLIYFIEIISAMVKQVALAIRLFANMLAGHVSMATILGLIVIFKNYGYAWLQASVSSLVVAFSVVFGFAYRVSAGIYFCVS